jgi:hypothetical protein
VERGTQAHSASISAQDLSARIGSKKFGRGKIYKNILPTGVIINLSVWKSVLVSLCFYWEKVKEGNNV